jgi:hypothetical protein
MIYSSGVMCESVTTQVSLKRDPATDLINLAHISSFASKNGPVATGMAKRALDRVMLMFSSS